MTNPRTDEWVSDVRAALVVAHPGHELCVYGWVKQVRPRVFVLTDGSGHSGVSRINRTSDILAKLQAEKGSLFGRFTDKFVYKALLNHDSEMFVEIAEELASQFMDQGITTVVGDAREDYNPTHDVCRLLIDAAVAIARKKSDREIRNFEYPIVGSSNGRPARKRSQGVGIALDADWFAEKIAAARAYFELKDDVDQFLKAQSEDSLRQEYLYPVNPCAEREPVDGHRHFYETHGEKRVREGFYQEVIRYEEHVLPIAMRLREIVSD